MVGLVVALTMFVDALASSALLDAQQRQLAQAAGHMSDRLDEDMYDAMREITLSAAAQEIKEATDGRSVERAQIWLDRLKQQLPLYSWIGVADRDGRVLAASDGLLTGADVSRRPWFSQGKAGAVALDVHPALLLQAALSPSSTDPARFVDVAAPVFNPDGSFGGVIAAHLNWTWADTVRGHILASVENLGRAEILILSDHDEILIGPHPKGAAAFDRVANDRDFVSVTAKTRGLGDYSGLGWRVVARQPLDAALSPIRSFRLVAVAGNILIALIFTALAGHVAKSVARPFEGLATATDEFKARPDALPHFDRAFSREAAKLTNSLRETFSALQRRDADLRQLNAELERKVEERTTELQHAKDEAEAATAAKGEFLASMSHEIRSPLGSIVGLTDLLLSDREIEGRQRQRLELIQSASAGLTTLVNDILDLSKFGSNSFRLEEKPFRLGALVGTCAAIMKAQADQKGIALMLDIAHDVAPVVVGDEHRIRQVLINLVGNAVKFTRAGSVTLTLTARETGDGCQTILFAITDTGIGIPAEKVGTLFQRYVQADISIQHEFGGTGLGLAISQRLVGLMGDEISVTSEEGRGSTFSFSLSLRRAELTDTLETFALPAIARPLHILLADDLVANQEIVTAMLNAAGHSVDVVDDGLAALRTASTTPYDLLLLDIQMPGLDGISVTRAIRRGSDVNATTPIVALTANVMPEQILRLTEAGLDAHVSKPIVRRDLIATIEAAMKVRNRDGRSGPARPALPAEPQPFARGTYDEILSLLGPHKIHGYLLDLNTRIGGAWPSAERLSVGETAHKIVGLAGMLGFVRLSELCRTLEHACDHELDTTALASAVATESANVLRLAARLAADCDAEPAQTAQDHRMRAERGPS